MPRRDMRIRNMAFSALLAAVYAALTMATAFFSYSSLQLRLAEVLCLLPFFFPHCSWGVFTGCLLANFISPSGALDAVFGSLATLLSCIAAAALGRGGRAFLWRQLLACLCPVVINAVIVGAVLAATVSEPGAAFGTSWSLFAIQVAAGEFVVCFALGLPMLRVLPKTRVYKLMLGE